MSQDRTDTRQGCALTEHCCGRRVSEDVRTVDGRFYPGPKQCGTYDVGDSRTCQRMKRSQYRSKHLRYLQRWPAVFYIEQNRVANILRQWKRFLATTLSADADSTVAPVDIGEFQLSDLAGRATRAGPKAEARLYLAV